MEKIKIIIKKDGEEIVRFVTDKDGKKTAKDIQSEIASIVGENPMREERR